MMRTIVGFAILAACGSSAPSDGIDITVTSASVVATLSAMTPPHGSFYAVVQIALGNDSAKTAPSTNPALFTLDTSKSAGIAPAPAMPTNACSAAVTVGRGQQIVCGLAFVLAVGEVPSELTYSDGLGNTAQSGFPLFVGPSVACETVSGWLGGNHATCTACLGAAEAPANTTPPQPQGACFVAAGHYTDACKTCEVTTPDACTFEPSCDSQACQALFEAEQTCLVDTCMASCS